MPPRRKRPSSSQSQPSQSSQPRPSKRAKLAVPPPPSSSLPLPGPSSLPSPALLSPALPAPPKRPHNPGTLRRLALPRPRNPSSTLSGAKVGGKSKDPAPLFAGTAEAEAGEEMYITRTGLGFSGYLKKGIAVFLQRGGMGAAIPLAMGVALAVKEEVGGTLEVRTGSETVTDEITPDDEGDDIVYQTRDKSTVLIEVSVSEVLTIGPPPSRSARGGRRGGGRGGRGRGRGKGA